ncbi:MAG: S1 RNA-binding domain-containing protein [Candidatus Micrarchaeota archaeon]
MANYPELGEFVIVSVNKIMPYGSFCSLDEYGGIEAFLHVSEVSSGWVKNIRDFIKEGQKIVALVSRIDLEKHQIDLSLKRVSESDRKRKLESFQLGKRAEKLLERAAIKLKKKYADAQREVAPILIAEYEDLYSAFEKIKEGEISEKIPPLWVIALKEVAEAEIKEKVLSSRAEIRLQSFESNGADRIKDALMKIQKGIPGVQVKYVGAPVYFVDFRMKEHKDEDKVIAKITKILEAEPGLEFSVAKANE